jgi:hypothetical protein
MVGKAQKSHEARSGLYGGCSNNKNLTFLASSRPARRSAPFLGWGGGGHP